MDEAFVVLVAAEGAHEHPALLQAFPFATRRGAELAAEWFGNFSDVQTTVIDDHEPAEAEADE